MKFSDFIKKYFPHSSLDRWLAVISVIISVAAIYYTSSQLTLADKVSKIETRAYLAIRSFNIIPKDSAFRKFDFFIHLENVGKTPAYNYNDVIIPYLDTVGTFCIDTVYNMVNRATPRIDVSITPSGQARTGFDNIITSGKPFMKHMLNKKYHLYFFGFIAYEDYFWDYHYQRFCVEYDIRNGSFNARFDYNNADRPSKE